MPHLREESWWLDHPALPQRHWARLRVFSDDTAEVFDLEGTYHRFACRDEAIHWLNEDEYDPVELLIEAGEVPTGVNRPAAEDDRELLTQMKDSPAGSATSVQPRAGGNSCKRYR